MTDNEHLHLVKQGVATWKDWRRSNPDVVSDLSEANLRKNLLLGVHFEGANLKETRDLEPAQTEDVHTDESTHWG